MKCKNKVRKKIISEPRKVSILTAPIYRQNEVPETVFQTVAISELNRVEWLREGGGFWTKHLKKWCSNSD